MDDCETIWLIEIGCAKPFQLALVARLKMQRLLASTQRDIDETTTVYTTIASADPRKFNCIRELKWRRLIKRRVPRVDDVFADFCEKLWHCSLVFNTSPNYTTSWLIIVSPSYEVYVPLSPRVSFESFIPFSVCTLAIIASDVYNKRGGKGYFRS